MMNGVELNNAHCAAAAAARRCNAQTSPLRSTEWNLNPFISRDVEMRDAFVSMTTTETVGHVV